MCQCRLAKCGITFMAQFVFQPVLTSIHGMSTLRMLSYAKNKQQMCWVTQHQWRSRQMWKIFTNSTQYTHFLSVTKNDLSWQNNLFMVMFQIISISSYAKNKLQMCWVTQHQCGSRQMWINYSQIHPVYSLFVCYSKCVVLTWTIYSWQAFNSLGCPLMLRTNNRCVESLNISVEVAKCGKYSQIHHSTLTFCLVIQEWPVLTQQSIHGKLSTH